MGTWELNNKDSWTNEGSLFYNFAKRNLVYRYAKEPFIWSTDIDGIFDKQRDWLAAGASLSYYLENIQYSHRNLIAHSHGLQVVAHAVKYFRADIRSVISVCSPLRYDLIDAYRLLAIRSNWTHVYANEFDLFSNLGSIFNKPVDKMSVATQSVGVDSISHSSLLYNKDHFPIWVDKGLFSTLR